MNAPRLKLPAYGRELLANRSRRPRGFHPLAIDVWYGDDWRVPNSIAEAETAALVREGRAAQPYSAAWERSIGVPTLAIRPREYALGVFDFRCVAGVAVTLWDCCGASADFDQAADGPVKRWGLFYFLAGELSVHAATVFFRNTAYEAGETAAHLAMMHTVVDPGTHTFAYPAWWSEALTEQHRAARPRWQADMQQRAARTASECAETR